MHPQKGRSRQRLLSVRTPSRHHFTLPNPGRIRPPCPLAVEQLNRSRRVLLRPLRQVGGNQQVQAATGPLCRRTSRSCSRSASQGAGAQVRKGPVGSGTTGTGEASPGARNARPVRKAAERAARNAADSAARKIPDSAAGTGPNVSSSLDASPTSGISFLSSVPPSLQAPISLFFSPRPVTSSSPVISLHALPITNVPSCLAVLPRVEVWPMRESKRSRLSKPTVWPHALLFISSMRQCWLPN